MATLRLQYTVVPPDRLSKDCFDKSWRLYYNKESKRRLKCICIYTHILNIYPDLLGVVDSGFRP